MAAFRFRLIDAETKINGNAPLLLFDNHDNLRIDMRYGDGVHNKEIERVIDTVLFASRGASLFCYGDEIGMVTTPPTRKEDVKDPIGITGWPKEKGRDGERTPMQWSAKPNAGFSTAKPWLPVLPSAATISIVDEQNDPDSLFNWNRSLIRMKKTVSAFAHGTGIMLDTENTKVLSWIRQAPGMPQMIVSAKVYRRAADGESRSRQPESQGRASRDSYEIAGCCGSGFAGSYRISAFWSVCRRNQLESSLLANSADSTSSCRPSSNS